MLIKIATYMLFPASISNGILGTTTTDSLIAIISILSSILTVIIGCFCIAFIKHISNHPPKEVVTPGICQAHVDGIHLRLTKIEELLEKRLDLLRK